MFLSAKGNMKLNLGMVMLDTNDPTSLSPIMYVLLS